MKMENKITEIAIASITAQQILLRLLRANNIKTMQKISQYQPQVSGHDDDDDDEE